MSKSPNDPTCPFHDRCFEQMQEQMDRRFAAHEAEVQSVKNTADAAVPWKVFWSIVSVSVVIIGVGFGWFGMEQRSFAAAVTTSLEKMTCQIGQAATTQAVMLRALERLEKQHDPIK